MSKVIVVGGGLSGLSAAHTLYERGANVLVLDKNPFFGGNSTKATSGINGAGTATQSDLNIPDSAKIFFDDTKSECSLVLRIADCKLVLALEPALIGFPDTRTMNTRVGS